MIKIAICDANSDDRLILQKVLLSFMKDNNLEFNITLFENPTLLSEKYEHGLFHLLFLEVKSNHGKNVNVGKMIRKQDACLDIVYCSTNDEFALKSHETFALSYLLKPFQRCKVISIMQHYILKNYSYNSDFIRVKYKRNNHILYYKDILYISSNDRIVTFYTLSQGEVPCYRKLKSIQEEIQDKRFLKCNRGYIINMDYIIAIKEDDFLTKNDNLVPIKLRDRKKIINTYYEYLESNK